VDRPGRVMGRIKPLLPVAPRRADHRGRKRLDDRKVLCGILFVLCTGIPSMAAGWEHAAGWCRGSYPPTEAAATALGRLVIWPVRAVKRF